MDSGGLRPVDHQGRRMVDAASVAEYLTSRDEPSDQARSSARNRLPGIVTGLQVDAVMAQVELHCGPFRLVSLMSSEAVRDLGLEVGSLATAVIKSTNVIVETT
jgi:molybdopterin-binding protein